MISGRWKTFGGLAIAAALSACSGTEGPQQPPMLADGACSQLRADLNAMDKRGVPSMIDARNNGKKYGPAQDAEINRYNQVLDQYLGGQCASEQRYKQKMGGAASGGGRQAAVQRDDVTTGSIPKTQVKRRKPMSEEESAAAAVDTSAGTYTGDETKPKRKTVSSQSGAKSSKSASTKATPASADAASPAPTAVKAESGLPSAPAPTKSDDGDKKD